MRTLAHIVNPVVVPPSSDLHVAQPITFETMRRARDHARGTIVVRLFATHYSEDRSAAPDGFEICPDLTRSILDVGRFERPRKLPLLADILKRLHDAAPDAEYLIYTNADIALKPDFYIAVEGLINDGYDSFVINRRTISASHSSVEDIPLMIAEAGKPHPGHDCFVFPRETLGRYFFGDVCLGVSGVGRAFILNLACYAKRFAEFKDLHLTFHIGSDKPWKSEGFADYAQFSRQQVDRVIEELERSLGPLASIPAAAQYMPYWRCSSSRCSGHQSNPGARAVATLRRLWSSLLDRFAKQ